MVIVIGGIHFHLCTTWRIWRYRSLVKISLQLELVDCNKVLINIYWIFLFWRKFTFYRFCGILGIDFLRFLWISFRDFKRNFDQFTSISKCPRCPQNTTHTPGDEFLQSGRSGLIHYWWAIYINFPYHGNPKSDQNRVHKPPSIPSTGRGHPGVCAETLRLDDGGCVASLDDLVPADLWYSALCLADVSSMFGRRSLSTTLAAWAMPSSEHEQGMLCKS